MAAILADDIFKSISLNENDRIPIKIPLQLVPMSPIDIKLELVSGNDLAPNRRQAIMVTNTDQIQGRINASLMEDE